MTLKEKFHKWLNTEPFSSKERPTLREAQCEQIADEFAIGFGEWLMKKGRYNITNWSKTTEELLEIYKKEKEL